MLQVISFDPGKATGWCQLSILEGAVNNFDYGEADLLGVGNFLFDNPPLSASLKNSEIKTVIVIEKFVMNSKITQSPWSLEVTGLVRYFAEKNHLPVYSQTVSQAKKLITDAVLKRAGLYTPGFGHVRDSVRHGLFHLVTREKVLRECLLKPARTGKTST